MMPGTRVRADKDGLFCKEWRPLPLPLALHQVVCHSGYWRVLGDGTDFVGQGKKCGGIRRDPVPVQMWQRVSPVPVQMWQRVSPVPVQMWQG